MKANKAPMKMWKAQPNYGKNSWTKLLDASTKVQANNVKRFSKSK